MTLATKLGLFPDTAQVNTSNHLVLGGCDAADLAAHFGTPLYVFDEATLRSQCATFLREFGQRHANSRVIYACKAFIGAALARLLMEEGLGLDAVSAGEIAIARSVGFPMERVYFHGNNKGREELRLALEWGVGRVVVDNIYELELLQRLAEIAGVVQDILLRVSPGIDPHTHAHTTTGILDSKFGVPLATGQAEEAMKHAMACSHAKLVGLHFHLGSPVFEVEPYQQAIRVVTEFAAQMRVRYGFVLSELSPGGGFAVQYVEDRPAPGIGEYAEAMTSALKQHCGRLGLGLPRLVLEPGRAIVGRAGVALYRVGAIKDIPGVRKYVSLDGGMGDNIRPALYDARYEALVANKVGEDYPTEKVTLAGKFCESGDILIRDIELPTVEAGDVVALPVSGAYCLAMASNYNASLKPAIVMVRDGLAQIIRRRETFDDLMRCDIVL